MKDRIFWIVAALLLIVVVRGLYESARPPRVPYAPVVKPDDCDDDVCPEPKPEPGPRPRRPL